MQCVQMDMKGEKDGGLDAKQEHCFLGQADKVLKVQQRKGQRKRRKCRAVSLQNRIYENSAHTHIKSHPHTHWFCREQLKRAVWDNSAMQSVLG